MVRNAVVVIGCGIMGRDIAAIFAAAGWSTQIVGRNEQRWAEVEQQLQASVAQVSEFDMSSTTSLRTGLVKFRSAISDIDWRNVRLVLEVVPEQLSLKRAIFAELDRLAPPDVVLGSNSSSLRITDIAQGLPGAARMANTHFFQPAHLVPLVEIAKGEQTSPETVDMLYRIFACVGRAPVRVNRDLPGFLANRIQHALMREAFSVIDSGLASAEDVDLAVQFGFGFRYAAAGPMLLKEFAGFDTQHAAAKAIYPSLCNDTAPSTTLTQLVDQGRLGMKSMRGFRDWSSEDIEKERLRYESALIRAAAVLGRPNVKVD